MLANAMASYYELGTTTSSSNNNNVNNNVFLQWPTTMVDNTSIMAGATIPLPFMIHPSKAGLSPEARALAACRSHKEAERQRRQRINGQLASLRTLLPDLIKTDKASVLGEVVRRVQELKKATSELIASSDHDEGDGCKPGLLPGDMDAVKLCRSENDSTILIVSLCCEDRSELIMDLTRALKSVKGKVMRAEMATVGGRMKCLLWVQGVSCGGGANGGPEGLLKRALSGVVDKPSSISRMGHGQMDCRMHRPY